MTRTEETTPVQPPKGDAVFRAQGITKTYHVGDVDVHALRGVDVELFAGEFVVLLGPSGSGKSTLLNILGGLDVPSAGTVQYFDHDLTASDDAALTRFRREHVGFVFQFYNLIPSLTARENVALVTDIAEAPMRPEDALAIVELGDRLDHFPSQLSGGEQQRVAIARAIAKRPDVLLCDEPTGALDASTGGVVPGTPLLDVGDPRDLEIVIDVLSTDAVQIIPGHPIVIDHWGGDQPLDAVVRLVEPSAFTKISALGIEVQRVNVIADFVSPAEDRRTLGDQFRVEARIQTWAADDVLQLPTSAVFRDQDRWCTFIVQDGKTARRVVTIGRQNSAVTEIVDGLESGETVVLYPGDQITDGTTVTATNDA